MFFISLDPIYVIVEYAPHGNLRQFLRSNRPPPSDTDQRLDPLLSVKDMVSFSLQIAKGMHYLASRKVNIYSAITVVWYKFVV